MKCNECKIDLTLEEEGIDELVSFQLCGSCYKNLIDYLVFFKLKSKYR